MIEEALNLPTTLQVRSINRPVLAVDGPTAIRVGITGLAEVNRMGRNSFEERHTWYRKWFKLSCVVVAIMVTLAVLVEQHGHVLKILWLDRTDAVFADILATNDNVFALAVPNRIELRGINVGNRIPAFKLPIAPTVSIDEMLGAVDNHLVVSCGDSLLALDVFKKQTLWKRKVGIDSMSAFVPGVSVVVNINNQVIGIAAKDGSQKWRASEIIKDPTAVSADGTTVVIATENGGIIGLNAVTGKTLWRVKGRATYLWASLNYS